MLHLQTDIIVAFAGIELQSKLKYKLVSLFASVCEETETLVVLVAGVKPFVTPLSDAIPATDECIES